MLKKLNRIILVMVIFSVVFISACSGSNEVDKMLNEYEKMVEKYMPLMEKASKGEQTAAEEMEKLGKEMEEWGKKWEDKMKNLSEDEIKKVQKRMMEITQKLYKKQ